MKNLFPLLILVLAACGGVREKQVLVFFPPDTPEITKKVSEILSIGSEKSIKVDTTVHQFS